MLRQEGPLSAAGLAATVDDLLHTLECLGPALHQTRRKPLALPGTPTKQNVHRQRIRYDLILVGLMKLTPLAPKLAQLFKALLPSKMMFAILLAMTLFPKHTLDSNNIVT